MILKNKSLPPPEAFLFSVRDKKRFKIFVCSSKKKPSVSLGPSVANEKPAAM